MKQEQTSLFWHRVKFIALILVFLSPFIGGWMAMYVFKVRPEIGNYGTLVQPVRKIAWPAIESADPQLYDSGFGKKWAFILFNRAECDALCRNNLHYMRQIKTLLARDTERLQNVFVSASQINPDMREYLQDFPDLLVIEGYRDEALYRQFMLEEIGQAGLAPYLYLVDPDQNLMMYYPPENDHYQVLDDIKMLMKLSQIG